MPDAGKMAAKETICSRWVQEVQGFERSCKARLISRCKRDQESVWQGVQVHHVTPTWTIAATWPERTRRRVSRPSHLAWHCLR